MKFGIECSKDIGQTMSEYDSNQERTSQYLENFDRQRVLKCLVQNPSPALFDVGANMGQSLDEFISWWPTASVFCFEPQKECWDALEQAQLEHKNNNVRIVKNAIGNTTGEELDFFTHDISNGLSGFNKVNLESDDSIQINKLDKSSNERFEYGQKFNHSRKVETLRLDDFMIREGIDHVDLLKIDTQGFEPEVLDGLGEFLSCVDVVLTELMFYDYYERKLSFSDLEQFLIPAGFSLYDINHISKNPMNGRTDWVDVIYVNERI